MRIKTQFIITMLPFGIIMVVIAASAIITHRQVDKANEQEKIASSIAQGASELSYLSNDYLIYRESHQLSRWQSRFASFSNQVAKLSVDKPEQQVLVRNIQANEQRLKQVFDSVASAVGGPSQNRSTTLDLAFLQVSWSRMAVQSQGLVSDASRLSQLLHQQMDQLIGTRTMLMYVMVGLFGLFLLASYMLTYRRILKSIMTLRAWTTAIGSGNLDFKIEQKKNDEIGDLSHAFNRMVADLKDITASKSELEREITERKRAEEALREAHERAVWLARFPDENPNPVLRVSADGTMLYCNPASAETIGWGCEVGKPLQGPLLPLVEQAMTKAEEAIQDMELGGRSYSVSVTPFPEERYANIYGRDITERKQAEEALVRAKEEWERTFDTVPDLVSILDNQHRIVRVNKAMADRLALPPEKCTGLKCNEAVHGLSDPPAFCPHALTCQDGQQHMAEVHEPRLGGDFLVSTTPLCNAHGQLIGAVHVARDITERKQAEEELRKSRDELEIRVQERTVELTNAYKELKEQSRILESFFKYTVTPLVFLDRDFNFIRVNEAYAKACQREVSEFPGHNHFEFYPSEARKIFEQVVETRKPYQAIARPFTFPDHPEWGTTYWDWNLTPILDDMGEVGSLVLSLEDVTKRKRAEEALRESESRLRHLSSQLLTVQENERKRISREIHDGIGQMLTAIKFKVEDITQQMSKGKANVKEKSLETIIPFIQESIEEVRRIQMDLRPSTLDDLGILATTDWFCREFEKIYSTIHIKKLIHIHENEVPAHLRTVIFRVMQEALNNIAKHSKADLVHLSLQKTDGKIELAIQDNGQGFNLMEVLSVESSKRGLGLTSMRERAELSGGSFVVESTSGKGTILRATWPI